MGMGRLQPRLGVIAFCVSASVVLYILYLYLTSPSRIVIPTFPFSAVPEESCGIINTNNPQSRNSIPQIVHYVWLLKDPAELTLSFKFFVTAYSSYILWQPERIYIHTDATPEVFVRAQKQGTIWTQRILAIPGITPNYVIAPSSTSKGVNIVHMEHKADFLRISALRDYGGIYLDVDAVPLRDVSDLRTSGFANVVGGATALTMKHSGYINNGVMMSIPNSTLMEIYYHAAHEFFDGSWATASVYLLTDLATRLSPLPSEVLILHPRAFAPTSWELEDQKRLFSPKLPSPNSTSHSTTITKVEDLESSCQDILAWLKDSERGENDVDPTGRLRDDWELDLSSSYVLHAFDDEIGKIRGWDHQVDLKYVLARQSNYARAVYPAIRHAIQAGVISKDEIG
ncbi:hypothetical protein BX600DRAFT_301105 [Xylariales sp. PMI_506]|nr:hypothetical protein BX600DRAFT_301105 [Xylariales sp. PMI_506]